MTRLASRSIIPFALLALAAGCRAGAGTDTLAAELAVDSTHVNQAEGALLSATVDGAESASAAGVAPATAEDAATFIAQHAATRYSPPGCVTVTQTGADVTLVFDQCTGPLGLRQLDGELDLSVALGAGGAIDVTAHASGLQIGAATMDLDSTAIYTVSGATRSLAVTTHGTGVGALGNDVVHDGDYTATWDASCVAIDGAWSTEAGDRARSTTASVMRCADACPTGTITRDTIAGRTIEVTFDGTDTATWTSSTGRSGTILLACGL